MKPKPMSPVVLADLRAYALDTSESGAGTAARILEAHDYWRARVRPQAEDIERMGVTRAHCEAWMLANGWTVPMPDEHPRFFEGPCERRMCKFLDLGSLTAMSPLELSGALAVHHGLGHWELLDRLALMEVG